MAKPNPTSPRPPAPTGGCRFAGMLTPLSAHPVRILLLVVAILVSAFLKYDEWEYGGSDETSLSDAYAYNLEATKKVEEGRPFSTYYNPLETLYLVATYEVFGVNLRLAKALQILCSFLLPVFFWRAGKRFFSEEAAFWSALFALIHPFPTYYAAHSWVEFWLIFLVSGMIFVYAGPAGAPFRKRTAFFLGLLGGVAALAKLWALPFSFLFAAFAGASKGGWKTRQFAFAALLWCVGAGLTLGPWVGFASYREGFFVPVNTNSAMNFFLGNNPQAKVGYSSAAMPDTAPVQNAVLPEGACRDLMSVGPEPRRKLFTQKCLFAYSWNFLKTNPSWLWAKLQYFSILWALPNSEYYQRPSRKLIYLHGHMTALGFFWVMSLVGFSASLKRWKEFMPYYLGSVLIWATFAMTFYLARFKAGASPLEILFAGGGMAAVEYGLKRFHAPAKPA